jgi:hypothetical protein
LEATLEPRFLDYENDYVQVYLFRQGQNLIIFICLEFSAFSGRRWREWYVVCGSVNGPTVASPTVKPQSALHLLEPIRRR